MKCDRPWFSMEFISAFHAYSSGSIDICSCYLRISSSGGLDVSGSGTGSGRARSLSSLPPSSPYPTGFPPFVIKEDPLFFFSGRTCAWLVRWSKRRSSDNNSSKTNNNNNNNSIASPLKEARKNYGRKSSRIDSNVNSYQRFFTRTGFHVGIKAAA